MSNALNELCISHFGEAPETISVVKAHASYRSIYRLKHKNFTAIGVLYDGIAENRAFVSFAQHFSSLGLPVPKIYAVSADYRAYLQEDLGDVTLYDFYRKEGEHSFSQATEELYEQVVDLLPKFQVEAGRTLDYGACYPTAQYGEQEMLWDIRYFYNAFLRRIGVAFNEESLQREAQRFVAPLATTTQPYFLYRDLQARNIMIHNGGPYFIDFQGGRRGPLQYDVATLIYHPKVAMPQEVRERLLSRYQKALAQYDADAARIFFDTLPQFLLVQLFHRFGTYGKLGIGAGQPYFLESIPRALAMLREVLSRWPTLLEDFPELKQIVTLILSDKRLSKSEEIMNVDAKLLKVTLGSFAYKNGLPQAAADSLSHGGFIFDCRSLTNPGREEAFQIRTGRDGDVVAYLENLPEVGDFYLHAKALVVQTVKRYLERGFTDLSVHFGCTGGQHRSVYMSERLQRDLIAEFPVAVTVTHRELIAKGML
jgi:aminoglycoside/choline kinase family phosphotransferase